MNKRKKKDLPFLSDSWSPPDGSRLEGGVGEPVACLTTTYEFDAGFFEAELLPRFLGLKFDHTENERTFILEREEALATTRTAVLVDISKFDPRQTTLQWEQLPIQCPGGVQHSKLTLLAWERLVRLIVTSANLTRSGYRRNREVFAALDFFDDPSSVPLRVLQDALGFIKLLTNWSRANPSATLRVRETVDLVQSRLNRWSSAPTDFRPRERPRVTLAVGHPAHEDRKAQSPLDQLCTLWRPRSVVRLTVMTPFVGQDTGKTDPVLERLINVPMARNVEGWLIVPEAPSPEDSEHRLVPLPLTFGQQWQRRFDSRGGAYVVPIPLHVDEEGKRNRELHSKAILIEGDRHELLMIGSSNFTPHGMGVGAFNCEANLAFEDWAGAKQDGIRFEDRLGLPVPWESWVTIHDLVWQQPGGASEDSPSRVPILPSFFAWASYSQMTGEIKVTLDRTQPEPPHWTIGLARESREESPFLFSRDLTSAEATTLVFQLEEEARGAHVVALRVSWKGEEGVEHEGFLAVSFENPDDLLPSEAIRNLKIENIIECLISGKEPSEWFESQARRRQKYKSTDAAIESLKAVDTSGYILYRARRFGRALAGMAERIYKTALSANAMRYRLLLDPFGPVRLAEALCETRSEQEQELSAIEQHYRLYALAEIVLCLGYICQHLRRNAGRNGKWLGPLFHEVQERLRAVARRLQANRDSVPKDLRIYLESTFAESSRLVGVRKEK